MHPQGWTGEEPHGTPRLYLLARTDSVDKLWIISLWYIFSTPRLPRRVRTRLHRGNMSAGEWVYCQVLLPLDWSFWLGRMIGYFPRKGGIGGNVRGEPLGLSSRRLSGLPQGHSPRA